MSLGGFVFGISERNFIPYLAIEDCNEGGQSLTNCIHKVVKAIEKVEGINASLHIIVYRDSEGIWDGWDDVNKEFVSLNTRKMLEAVDRFDRIIFNNLFYFKW